MYKIYANGRLLSSPRLAYRGYSVGSPEIIMEVNRHGSMTFTVSRDNPLYDELEPRTTYIQVYDETDEIFYGRIIDIKRDILNMLTVYAESSLAFFVDSIYRPFGYKGDVEGFFRLLLENHNAQVDSARQMQVGIVTVLDLNDTIVRSSMDPATTWDLINDKLLDMLGGYLQIRVEGGVRYIDYLANCETLTGQTVESGKNLIDITKLVDASDVITCLLPYGAAFGIDADGYEETPENAAYDGNRLTIRSVNDDLDYIKDDDAIEKYGMVWGTYTWDDVTEPENLLKRAKAYLSEKIARAETITATVVDLHLINSSNPRLKSGYYLPVFAKTQNINQSLLCTKQHLYLEAPDKDELTLGVSYRSLTGIQARTRGG